MTIQIHHFFATPFLMAEIALAYGETAFAFYPKAYEKGEIMAKQMKRKVSLHMKIDNATKKTSIKCECEEILTVSGAFSQIKQRIATSRLLVYILDWFR